MKLTQLKCPACNATLRVLKENSSIAVCDYCGLQYLIETDAGGIQWVHPQGQPTKKTQKEAPQQQENSNKDSIGKKIVSGVIFLIAILISFSSLIKPKVKKDFKEQVEQGAKSNSVTMIVKTETVINGIFADMAEEVFHKSREKITEEELKQFQWITLTTTKDIVKVGYSFENPYEKQDAKLNYLEFARSEVVLDYSVLTNFSGLKKLELDGTLPKGALKGLSLIGLSCKADNLQELAESLDTPEQLRELAISYGIETLAGLQKFSGLQILNLANGRNLTELKELASLPKLQSLTILSCDKITDYSMIAILSDLTELKIGADSLRSINFISSLQKLKNLSIVEADLLNVDELKKLKNLTSLTLEDISNLQDLKGIESLTNLTELSLEVPYACSEPNLTQLTSLKKLTISGMKKSSFLRSLTQLEELNLSSCEVESATDFAGLTSLTSLKMRNLYGNINKFSFLNKLSALEILELRGNFNYEDITTVFLIPTIKTLRLNGIEGALDLSKLKENPSLISLYLDGATFYENVKIAYDGPFTMVDYDTIILAKHLDILSYFPNLEILTLEDNKLADLNALSSLTKLQKLDIQNNYITDLTPLASLNELKEINCIGNSIDNYRVLKDSVIIFK